MGITAMTTKHLKHTKFKIVDDVGVVAFNSPDSKVNVLNNEVTEDFQEILCEIQTNPHVHAVVLISQKPGCFIAGADVNMLENFKSSDETTRAAQSCQKVFELIETSKKPVVAAIHGSCLGAGLEAALACHYRIATNTKATRLGLPEVMLGILPGAGGTQRLPRIIFLPDALDMILTGKMISGEKAKELGIIDLLLDPLPGLDVPEKQLEKYLEEVAVSIAKKLVNGEVKVDRSKRGLYDKIMVYALQYEWVKDKIFDKAREHVMKQSEGLYPAPLKILEVVRIGLDSGIKTGYEAEAKAFGELVMTTESKNLLSLFRAQTECKKNKFGQPQNIVKTIGIVGAGFMGVGIAYISLCKGYTVILKDINQAAIDKGVKQIQKTFDEAVNKKRITSFEKESYLSKLKPTLVYDPFHVADMVIEAVFEDILTKQRVIAELETVVPSYCIIACNTSAIPISKVAQKSLRPDKIIGMHYFSPVEKMQLLEIVTSTSTSKDTTAAATTVGLKQGKLIIAVNDGPGFYTSRLLATVVLESIRLLQEGLDPKHLNKLTKKFGFPVGFATLFDEIGLDVILCIVTNLVQAFGERFSGGNPTVIRELVQGGFVGRKSGTGIFIYEKNSKEHEVNPRFTEIIKKYPLEYSAELIDEDRILRIVSRFANEAMLCLEEEIISNPLEGNIGAVFGLGFPPYTGGPFHWIDNYGADKLVSKMEMYKGFFGLSFQPAKTLVDLANDSSKKFFSKL